MTPTGELQDVVVIGGGPAGSTAATILARSGHRVTVLEKAKFPRDHVGESLLPFCYGLFQEIGVLDEMKRRFVRKPGVQFLDRDGERFTNWCFSHVISDPSYLSFQVLRSEFDQLLLENCRAHGATVKEGTRVSHVNLDEPDGLVSVVAEPSSGRTQSYRARFLLDASGRDTFLGNRMGTRRKNQNLDRTALWSHFAGAELSRGLEEGLSVIIYMGEEKRGWIWIFPLGRRRVTVGVVMENAYIRGQKKVLARQGSQDWQLDLFLQEIMLSGFIRKVLSNARMTRPLMINGDYSYYVQKKYGRNFALIGDAHRFIDPIFSSGVFLSMKSGHLVANALDEMLGNGGAGNAMALTSVYEMIEGAYEFVHRMIKLFYNPHAINWAQAGSAQEVDQKRHETAMAAGHYMLAGDFFENHVRYNRVFELFEDRKNFERYKNLVIDRKSLWADSCNSKPTEVFSPALTHHDRRRDGEDEKLRVKSSGQRWTTVVGAPR